MKYKVGDVYRAKTGELLEVAEFEGNEFCFRVRDPVTTEYAEGAIYGPVQNLNKFINDAGLEKIDLTTYIPTGLVKP